MDVLGDDPRGLPLEVGGVEYDDLFLVVHLQPIYQRQVYISLYEIGKE